MNLLQVAPHKAYPPHHGGAHRTHGLVKSIPPSKGSVVRFCQSGPREQYLSLNTSDSAKIAPDYTEYWYLHPIHDFSRLPSTIVDLPLIFLGQSLSLVTPHRLQKLAKWADVVLVEGPWQFNAVQKLVETAPIVYSSHNVEAERFESYSTGWIAKKFLDKLIHIEKKAVAESDAVLCTSVRDKEEFKDRYESNAEYYVLPNSTYRKNLRDTTHVYAPDLRSKYGISTDSTVCLFVGSNYEPNVEAVNHILEMATEIQERRGTVHFVIVGSVGESIDDIPSNVTVTGFVNEIESHFDMADIALNPIESGSGTNVKLIDYLARGIPTITTSFGARGLSINDDTQALIRPVSVFPAAILDLVDSKATRIELAENGRQLVADEYIWNKVSQSLGQLLQELVEK